MSYIPVIDTVILSKNMVTSADGRALSLLELQYPDFTGEPGQFVMIQKHGEGLQWSYPYMIYACTAKGLQIIASETSSLFQSDTDDPVSVWGANGKGCFLDKQGIFVAEPATLPLILPLVRACSQPHLIIIGSETNVPLKLLPSEVRFTSDRDEVLSILHSSNDRIYMALNLSTLETVIEPAVSTLKDRITLFTSTRIGCGIGACRSCYLHSPTIHMGIPVCCNGPYLPYNMIDFDKDRKCFQTFR